MHSMESRRVILDMWKTSNPCSSPRPNHYARPDLTKTQLQADKLLRQQLLVAGKDRYMIQRGRIVESSTTATPVTIPLSVVPAPTTPGNSVPAADMPIDVTARINNLSASTVTASLPTPAIYSSTGPASNASAKPTIVSVSGNTLPIPPVAIVTTNTLTVPTLITATSPTTMISVPQPPSLHHP